MQKHDVAEQLKCFSSETGKYATVCPQRSIVSLQRTHVRSDCVSQAEHAWSVPY